MSIEKQPQQKSGKTEVSDSELENVSGGTDPKPAPKPTDTKSSIGSQSTGAGAGKVTFNPF